MKNFSFKSCVVAHLHAYTAHGSHQDVALESHDGRQRALSTKPSSHVSESKLQRCKIFILRRADAVSVALPLCSIASERDRRAVPKNTFLNCKPNRWVALRVICCCCQTWVSIFRSREPLLAQWQARGSDSRSRDAFVIAAAAAVVTSKSRSHYLRDRRQTLARCRRRRRPLQPVVPAAAATSKRDRAAYKSVLKNSVCDITSASVQLCSHGGNLRKGKIREKYRGHCGPRQTKLFGRVWNDFIHLDAA